MLARIVAAGLLAALVGACGGDGGGDGGSEATTGGDCPRGAPQVSLTRMAFTARPDAPDRYDVAVTFEVVNDTPAPVVIETIDLYLFGHLKRPSWDEPPTVPASETATFEGQLQVRAWPAELEAQPETDDARVEWRWGGERYDDCAVPLGRIEPVTGDVTETVGPTPTSPPRDLLALGETATFSMPDGQQVRLTITDVAYSGTCPEPGAGPPLNGARLFVTLRLEVTPGSEPWLVNAGHFTVGGLEMMSASQAGLACVGPLGNNLQAAPGQTAEGVFVYDTQLGPTELTYRFAHAAGIETEATWDISTG